MGEKKFWSKKNKKEEKKEINEQEINEQLLSNNSIISKDKVKKEMLKLNNLEEGILTQKELKEANESKFNEAKVEIKLKNLKDLYTFFKTYSFSNVPILISKLKKPLIDINVVVDNDRDECTFFVQILRIGKAILPKNLINSKLLKIKIIDEDFIVSLNTNGEQDFEIIADTSPKGIGGFIIRAGGLGTAPARKIENLEKFTVELKKLATIIEEIINGVYEESNIKPPDLSLTFSIPLHIKAELKKVDHKGEGKEINIKEKLQIIDDPQINFEDIGGQKEAKEKIEDVAYALRYPELCKRWGGKLPHGVLLYGPPGCGKTMLAQALATKANASLWVINFNSIFSKYYSVSSQLVENLFELAREESKDKKIILFFDEIDAFVSNRNNDIHEETRKVLAALNKGLSGVKDIEGIFIICATNRKEDIDEAFLRAGRIDIEINVPKPDEEGRKEIFKIHMDAAEKNAIRKLFEDIDFDLIAKESEGMNGADIAEIVRRTINEAMKGEENEIKDLEKFLKKTITSKIKLTEKEIIELIKTIITQSDNELSPIIYKILEEKVRLSAEESESIIKYLIQTKEKLKEKESILIKTKDLLNQIKQYEKKVENKRKIGFDTQLENEEKEKNKYEENKK